MSVSTVHAVYALVTMAVNAYGTTQL